MSKPSNVFVISDPLGSLLGLPVELFIAGYSKDQELEADRYGTALTVEGGYSPLGILQLFKEFGRLEEKTGRNATLSVRGRYDVTT